ncbi:hypothetical protein AVEN_29397-1 [Araneus ventricosus]|uniref:Uncharacterized protein n=1 Tax=Araneus ventricosus TaxID=182803 RepID=A0A4Y2TJ31_ARAVE|nr:hypothetical protein AVEN_29397-1 [Araneus ventricosus]
MTCFSTPDLPLKFVNYLLGYTVCLALSIRERPKRLFKQKTVAVRNGRISLRKFQPLSLSVIDFSPAARAFFVRVVRPDGLGEKGDFLRIRTVPAVIEVSKGGGEFPLPFKEELGRSRILRSLYSNGLRNQRVNTLPRRCTASTWISKLVLASPGGTIMVGLCYPFQVTILIKTEKDDIGFNQASRVAFAYILSEHERRDWFQSSIKSACLHTSSKQKDETGFFNQESRVLFLYLYQNRKDSTSFTSSIKSVICYISSKQKEDTDFNQASRVLFAIPQQNRKTMLASIKHQECYLLYLITSKEDT